MLRLAKGHAIGVVVGAALCASGMGAPAAGQDQPIVLKIHNFHAPLAAANTKLLKPFGERMARETNGRLRIEVYPAMQLGGKAEELYAQARSGVVDGIWTVTGFTPGKFPRLEVFSLPFISGNAVATSAAILDLYRSTDWLKKEMGETTPLMFHVASTEAFHSKKPIKSIADLKGLKLRTADRVMASALQELGANVVGMTLPDAVTALQRGIIDGASSSWIMGKTVKICDLTDYHTDVPGFSKTIFVFTLNSDSYNKLPADMRQKIMADMSIERAKELGKIWDDDEVDGEAYCAKSGTIHKMPAAELAEWRRRLQPQVDAWAAQTSKDQGIDGAKLVADARRFVARHAN
jgi:TRAP-type C4-dicarboxylate transport system substrate-binding protein